MFKAATSLIALLTLTACTDNRVVCEKDGALFSGNAVHYVDGRLSHYALRDHNGIRFRVDESNSHLFTCQQENSNG